MIRAAIILSGLVAVAISIATAVDTRWIFAATGFWALTLILVPFALVPSTRTFSVWSLASLTIFLGLVVRGTYLSLRPGDPDLLDQLFFLGQSPDYFLEPAIPIIVGLASLVSGYLLAKPKDQERPLFKIHTPTLYMIAAVILVISTIATALYIQRTGGFESGLLSAKRTPLGSLEIRDQNYQSHGALRFLASLAIFAHVLVFAHWLRDRRPLALVFAVLLLAVACTIPFYASIRTTVAIYLLFPVAMTASARVVIPATIGIVLLVTTMTALRPDERASPLLETAILNRNQIELPKTAHIYHSDLEPAYGATIARWLVAPVPREIWPDKPIIPPGPTIGSQIYDQRVAGVPPSMFAEWYWNFRWPGVLIGSFLFGGLLRWLDRRPDDPFRLALFVVGPLMVGYESIGSSIGGGLYQCGFRWLIAAALLWCVRIRAK